MGQVDFHPLRLLRARTELRVRQMRIGGNFVHLVVNGSRRAASYRVEPRQASALCLGGLCGWLSHTEALFARLVQVPGL